MTMTTTQPPHTCHRIDTGDAGPVLSRVVVMDATGGQIEAVEIVDTGERRLGVLGSTFARPRDAFAMAYEYVRIRYGVVVDADTLMDEMRAMRDEIAEHAADRLQRECDDLREDGYTGLAESMRPRIRHMRRPRRFT